MSSSDEEKGHGLAKELDTPPSDTLQRPLTAEEKLAATTVDIDSHPSESSQYIEYNGIAAKQDNGILSKLRRIEARMDAKLGVESEAIDRKLPEERTGIRWHDQVNMALLWASGTMNISCFATGFIGPYYFSLSLKQSLLCIIFASLLGAAVTGFNATFGAATGLRQISVGRYSMGWWPNKIIAVLNFISQLGWSAVACITGGLALQAVSGGSLSVEVGIVIIACCAYAVSFIGLKAILVYEKFAWAIYFVIFMIIFGETAPYYYNHTLDGAPTGATLSGRILSLLAIIFGSSASWAPMASDYYVMYAADVSRTKVFVLTTLGIAIPTSIGMCAGASVASAFFTTQPAWGKAEGRGLGFLIQTMLYPRGFADFILVLLAFSGINTTIISIYSASLSCQQFARPFARIPRFIWATICFLVTFALASAGRNELLTYLQNFLSLLGYWCTSYFVIIFSEHYFFRKGNFENYNLEGWNNPNVLPLGLAAGTAFGLGIIAWVMGMNETWYIGPLSALIGEYGGDVGNQFTLVVTALSFIPLRHLELKYVGR